MKSEKAGMDAWGSLCGVGRSDRVNQVNKGLGQPR